MRTSLVFYDPVDGRILTSGGYADVDIELNRPTPESLTIEADNADQGTQYVQESVLVSRPELSLVGIPTQGLAINEEMVVTGLPVGTEVHHQEGMTVIDDGSLEWSTNTPGKYFFRILNFPHQEVFFCVQVEL
jgi:hypothetical protein